MVLTPAGLQAATKLLAHVLGRRSSLKFADGQQLLEYGLHGLEMKAAQLACRGVRSVLRTVHPLQSLAGTGIGLILQGAERGIPAHPPPQTYQPTQMERGEIKKKKK